MLIKDKKGFVGIKLGSRTLVNGKKINEKFISSVCEQNLALQKIGYDSFLVSSGAIASASYFGFSSSLRAVVGQNRLMSVYEKFFNKFKIKIGQLLLTDDDFEQRRFNIKWILLEAFINKVILIINANDGIWKGEIKALKKCADNDILFLNVCKIIRPKMAVIGITEQGLLNPKGNIVSIVNNENFLQALSYTNGKNSFGRGGMKPKVEVAHKLANMGIKTVLAPAREPDFILRAIKGEKNFGTTFI
ncbi:MAG: hypothetical protein U9O55_00265 [Patescibacteria group bacterium]|nr:hypothetical protein [Patescibacteria group bacterium]